jgi:hypothetical protein
MRKPLTLLKHVLTITVAVIAAMPPPAIADTGVGVDLQLGNKLDPTGGVGLLGCDPRGGSWLLDTAHRTPTGNLYTCPPPVRERRAAGDWLLSGEIDFGALNLSGDKDNFLFQRYSDWSDGFLLGGLRLNAERPYDGSYLDLRASRISDHDQYYKLTAGRYGSYKLQLFLRDLPNVVSDNAKPIWNGVGTNNLTLPSSLTPAASPTAAVAAVSAATPERRLQINRQKEGLGLDYYFSRSWTAYLNITDEQRKGVRPFGGSFFFNYFAPLDGGILETVKPINDYTVNVNGGSRYAGSRWRMDFAYSGSFYRDHYSSFNFQDPFGLFPVIAGAVSARVYQGQFAMEPSNDYHNVRATLTRVLSAGGEASLSVAQGWMLQNQALLPPINCQGSFGIDLSPTGSPVNPFLYPCSSWNTTAALSQRSADMRIDSTAVNGSLVLRPTNSLTWRTTYRYYRENYPNSYLMYNPLTGQYGYINENGAQGSVVPGEVGFFDPTNPTLNSALTRVRNLPLSTVTNEASTGLDWRLTPRDTLGATVTFNRYEPENRERARLDATSLKLTWLNHSISWLTLRANYTYLHQSGDTYNYDPYGFTFSTSLAGYVVPASGVDAHTVDAMRKYDMSSRTQNKVDLMGTFMPRDDMTVTATFRGDWNQYSAVVGRQQLNQLSAMLQWEWQVSPSTNASAFYGYDQSSLHLSNVNETGVDSVGSDPRLGGAEYPLAGLWSAHDRQGNHTAGILFNQQLRRVRVDAGWNFQYARGTTGYSYASPLALAYADVAALGQYGFPDLTYRLNSANVSLLVPLTKSVSLRLFDNFEQGLISDWHYAGFDQSRVYNHRVYSDGGPHDYSANIIGMLINVKL